MKIILLKVKTIDCKSVADRKRLYITHRLVTIHDFNRQMIDSPATMTISWPAKQS